MLTIVGRRDSRLWSFMAANFQRTDPNSTVIGSLARSSYAWSRADGWFWKIWKIFMVAYMVSISSLKYAGNLTCIVDMLNQNYNYVGNKRNCRIALGIIFSNFVLLHSYSHTGPYSNPMCHVADGFRCIVLVEAKKIDFTDPPFLNRFEKQSFAYLYITISLLNLFSDLVDMRIYLVNHCS